VDVPTTERQQPSRAVKRSLLPATDDRKARRVCSDLRLPEPRRTLDILHSYADAASLSHPQIREILIKIRDRASFQPPRNDPTRNVICSELSGQRILG
jgi:hypothetical protein